MRSAPLKPTVVGFFSAAVLAAVPVAAWLIIAPASLPETHAAMTPGGMSAGSELGDVSPVASAANLSATERTSIDAAGSVMLLDAWYYTNHSCASERGRGRGKGHDKHKQKSPKDCPRDRDDDDDDDDEGRGRGRGRGDDDDDGRGRGNGRGRGRGDDDDD